MIFSIINYPRLIIKSYIFYIQNLQLMAILKFSLFWPLILSLSIINNTFLMLDYLFFNFKNIEIKSPLFIIGFPRSGTTFLHKVISNDSQFTTAKFWELMFAPSITQKYIFNIFFIVLRPFNGISFLKKIFNMLLVDESNKFHEIRFDSPEEDYLTLVPQGACFLLILFMPINDIWKLNDFDNSFDEKSKNKLMRIYKKFIQRHLYFHGINKIYLSKNPSFTSMSKSLKKHFPDCCQIGCHREPHESIPSLLSSMEHGYKMMSRSILDYNDVELYINMYKNYYSILTEQDRINNNFLLIKMNELKNDLENTISNIYKNFNFIQTMDFQKKISIQSNKSKKYISKHNYNLNNFNLNENNIKNNFSDYYKSE